MTDNTIEQGGIQLVGSSRYGYSVQHVGTGEEIGTLAPCGPTRHDWRLVIHTGDAGSDYTFDGHSAAVDETFKILNAAPDDTDTHRNPHGSNLHL